EMHDVASVAGLEPDGAVGSGRPGAELPRLGHGAARQLGPADPGREAEVVLDPARRSRLAAERGALDHERVETLRGPIHGCRQPSRPGADDEQVDLFAALELAAYPERTEDVTARRVLELEAARKPHERRLLSTGRLLVVPAERQPVGPRHAEHPHRRPRRARPHELDSG